ncbi:amino acid adenylation domain-containing protein [Paenibacillus harenae]|uniref:amino acid adenylation domain-containing protein n=1 Tax=Paenibacillus harenae TaxID=306543 RepID=UPI00041043E9|nr:non-ribosomal peptide synthetase [Paenibacillus harenae]
MSTFRKEQVKDIYYLSPMQEGMLFHTLMSRDASYFEQMTVRIRGELNVALFEESMNLIVERYDVFRTTFLYDKVKRPIQVVLKDRPLKIQLEDLSGLTKEAQEVSLESARQKDREAGFDLSRDIPMRMIVFRLAADEYEMIWSHHHILMDGWCLGIIINELFSMYGCLKRRETPALAPAQPYSDYIKWLEKQDKEKALAYWRELLGDYEQGVSLPKRKAASNVQTGSYEQAELRFGFGLELSRKLQELASSLQITLNSLFQTLWGVMLQRYNHLDDVVFGSVVSGRPSELPGIETMVGLFINTIPVRIRASGNDSFAELAASVQRKAIESEGYDYMPLYDIQNLTELKNNLINHIIVFENYPVEKEVSESGSEDALGFDIGDVSMYEQTSYDLNIMVLPSDDLTVKLIFNASVYDPMLLQAIEGHLITLAEQAAADPGLPVRSMRIVTNEEQRLLESFHGEACDYQSEHTVHRLFEEQAARSAEAAAIVSGAEQITYSELNEAANQMAHRLRRQGVGPGKPVGIMADRSIAYVTGVLAVLKAGGAFVPIDPDLPAERAAYMLDNSGAEMFLIQTDMIDRASAFVREGITLQLLQDELYAQESSDNLPPAAGSNDLLYVIYTSGTTGLPKGVMLEHKNMVNLLSYVWTKTTVPYHTKVLQYTTISFDVCYQEIFSTLLAGGTLCLIDNDTKSSVEKLTAWIGEQSIPVLFLPVPFLKFIFNEKDYAALFPHCVKHIITAGEQLVVSDGLRAYLREREVTLHNHYGPSETHVVTTLSLGALDTIAELPAIGRPISNTGIYILNSGMQLQPVGIPGELFITGENVGRGYIGNAQLTAEKFLQNPYRSAERMYRTGDLACWLPNGDIELQGRMDHQVKIRGHRIELGEIESRLLNHPAITEAAALAYEDNQKSKYLCAYFAASEMLTTAGLRDYMLEALPDYMVPSFFVQLERLPITPNGKTDRRGLPMPEGSPDTGAAYVAPTNELQRKLATIWEEVLGVAQVGIRDSFFALGGHSLKAMMLVSGISKQCGVDVPLRILFERPTIEALTPYLADDKQADTDYVPAVPQAKKQELYPVSSAQKRMFVLNQLGGAHTGYNIPGIFLLEGEIDIARFEEAMRKLVDRHESLRTSFTLTDGEPVQRVHDSIPFNVNRIDISDQPEAAHEPAKLIERFVRPFDLHAAPLFRVELVKLAADRHLLLFDLHHIIADGVSLGIVIKEFTALYHGEELPELRIQFKDIAVWQNSLVGSEAFSRKEAFWLEQFSGDLPLLDLPADYARPAVRSFEGDHLSMLVEPELAAALDELAAKEGATLYMVMLAAYFSLLYKYTGHTDMIVGSPVAGRTHDDMNHVVGMFVNTLALRAKPAGDKTFRALMKEVKETSLLAFEHQDYPYETLLEKLDMPRDLSRNPLFDAVFMVQNLSEGAEDPDGLKVTPCEFENKWSKFDLTLLAEPSSQGITLGVEFSTALFKKDSMVRFLSYYSEILKAVVRQPEQTLAEINMLTAEDSLMLLEDFNDTSAEIPAEGTVSARFEQQASRMPHAAALKLGNYSLSYAELNAMADRMAARLRRNGVRAEAIVGVMMERSVEMVVSMLAIVKAGGAYLPIDIDYPAERIQYIVQDSGAKLLVTRQRDLDQVRGSIDAYSNLLVYEEDNDFVVHHDGQAAAGSLSSDDQAQEEQKQPCTPKSLAYVIYTSGTTGKPKGTLLEHRGLVNLQHYFQNHYGIGEGDRIAQFASSSFDASVWEIVMALFTGASLHIVPKESLNDYASFEAFMNEEQITVITLPPAFAIHLEPERLPYLRRLITAGSAASRELVTRWIDRVSYVNAYGPTETTICATACEIDEKLLAASISVPIGKPITNTKAYIVSHDNQLQPIGVPGELCIGGAGVARGYLNRPKLTDEKFVPCPFIQGERMYRTGDLARWQPDGSIEYLGRIDHQVKIRGFRIELGEIETAMLQKSSVDEAIVLALTDERGDAYLCAFYTAQISLDPAGMREHLEAKLPGYMLPARFIPLERMPLTANGKIDRRALHETAGTIFADGTLHIAPRTETEEKLAGLWSELLGAKRIGIHDDFFKLGGHSLKAMSLISKIIQVFGVKLELSSLFERSTLEALAAAIDRKERIETTAIVPLPNSPHYEVSAAQRRMYIMHQFEGEGTGYNMPGAMIIEGEINPDRLQDAFRSIIQRHETFRTTFHSTSGEPVQKIHMEAPFEISYRHAGEAELGSVLNEFVQPFDLEQAPLLRVGLVMLEPARHLLMFDMHHIIADGVSMAILVREFVELYAGRELPALNLQYKDFAAWQNQLFASSANDRMKAFWKAQFEGGVPQLSLPTDFGRQEKRDFAGDSITFGTIPGLKDKLLLLSEETGSTVFMVLLAAYHVLLSKYSGQTDIVIGVPAAGRPRAELDQVMGMFVNTLALRNIHDADLTFSAFILQVKKRTLEAFEHQDFPLEQLIAELDLQRDLSRNPLFDTVFSLQNIAGEAEEIDGLRFEPYEFESSIAKFDLTLSAVEEEADFRFSFEYAAALFKRDTVIRLAQHLIKVLETVTNDPSIRIGDIQLIEAGQMDNLLGEDVQFQF